MTLVVTWSEAFLIVGVCACVAATTIAGIYFGGRKK